MRQTSRSPAYLAEAAGLLQSGAWDRSNTSHSRARPFNQEQEGFRVSSPYSWDPFLNQALTARL